MLYTKVETSGRDIMWMGYDSNGKKVIKKEKFSPSLFIPNDKGVHIGMDGRKLSKKVFDNVMAFHKYYKDNNDTGNLYGSVLPIYQFISEKFTNTNVDYDLIKTVVIDIEVYSKEGFPDANKASDPITVITIKDIKTGRFFVLALDTIPFSVENISLDIDKSMVSHFTFSTQRGILDGFMFVMDKLKPDIITGWNTNGFDLPYLYNAILRHKGEQGILDLSPFNRYRVINQKYNNLTYYDPILVQLDYLLLYKKFNYVKKERYTLDYIANDELGVQKQEYDGSLEDFMKNDPQKYIEYNIWDVELVSKLDEKLDLIRLACYIAYESRVNIDDVFSPVKLWDVLIYNKLLEKRVVILPKVDVEKKSKYSGAYVIEPRRGLHKWTVSYDINSLYPNIIISFNISPETLISKNSSVIFDLQKKLDSLGIDGLDCQKEIELIYDGQQIKDDLKKISASYTPNGALWKTDRQGYIPEIMQHLYEERKSVKASMKGLRKNSKSYKAKFLRQYALKILLNSGYGIFGNNYFRCFNHQIATGITSVGQLVINVLARYLQETFDKVLDVVYGDSVAKNSEVIVELDDKIQFRKISDLFLSVDEMLENGKEYCFFDNMKTLTIDENGKSVFKPVKYIVRHKTSKMIYRVYFTNYWYIDVTEDHSLIGYLNTAKNPKLNPSERLVEVKPVDIGKDVNSIIALKNIPSNDFKTHGYPKEVYEFMGFFVGDGSFCRNKKHNIYDKDYYLGLSLGKDGSEIFARLIEPLINKGYINNFFWSKSRGGDIKINGFKLVKIISEHFRDDNGKKIIPEWIFREKKENICAFLRGLFSADGTVMFRNNSPIIKYTSINGDFIYCVRRLLFLVGISNSVFKDNTVNIFKDKKINVSYSTGSQSKNIIIKDKDMFTKHIGFILDRKNAISFIKTNPLKTKNIKNFEYDLQSVKKIEKIAYDDYVYDLEVEDTHRFFANNVLVHNTDSIYLSFDKFSQSMDTEDQKDIMRRIGVYCKKYVEPKISEILERLISSYNARLNTLKMEQETVGDVGLWVAKKKYITRKLIEGGIELDEPELQIKGIEVVRTSTPMLVRKKLKDLLTYILDQRFDELYTEINRYKKEVFFKALPNEIAFPRTVNNLEDYYVSFDEIKPYTKRTPIHVRGSLLYNMWLKKHKLVGKYPMIFSGDKIRFLYLKTPNPINENVIAFVDVLPVEFGLNKFVDYQTQFEKSFLSPLKIMLDACKIDLELELDEGSNKMKKLFLR